MRRENDQTQIFDDNEGMSLFSTAHLIDVNVKNTSAFSRHVLEDGTSISDNQINQLAQIMVHVVVATDDYATVFQRIDDYRKAAKRFIIQTRVKTYDLMFIETLDFQESSKVINAVQLTVGFIQQRLVVNPQNKQPSDPKNKDTVNSGTK